MLVFINILFGLMGTCVLGLIFCLYQLHRIQKIYAYRLTLLKRIEAVADMSKDDVQWRLNEYNKVTFTEMLNKFWKPLDNFYEDKKFIE